MTRLTILSSSSCRSSAVLMVLAIQLVWAAHAQTPASEPVVGAVRMWSLSEATRASSVAIESYPDEQKQGAMRWVEIRSEPSGLVDIAKHRAPLPSSASQVWARARLRAVVPEERPIAFGYCDNVTMFLNGRPIFRGNHLNAPTDRPLAEKIGWKDVIYLPLERGDNELMLLVSAASGGWGFMCRDLNEMLIDPSLSRAWEAQNRVPVPESVAYDPRTNSLYVSSFANNSIAKIGVGGEVIAVDWAKPVQSPSGVLVWKDRVYAVERPGIVEINVASGEIVKRYPVAGSRFLNDLSIDEQGAIFVTDSAQGAIYRISNGQAELWLQSEALGGINSILAEPGRLLVGVSKDAAIKAVNLDTKEVTTLATISAGAIMDGLVRDGRGGYLISDYRGRVYRMSAEGQTFLLLDRTGPSQFSADIEYIPEKGLLVIPSLFDNRLTAYTYKP